MAMTIRFDDEELRELEIILNDSVVCNTKSQVIRRLVSKYRITKEYNQGIQSELRKLEKKHSNLCAELKLMYSAKANIQSIIED